MTARSRVPTRRRPTVLRTPALPVHRSRLFAPIHAVTFRSRILSRTLRRSSAASSMLRCRKSAASTTDRFPIPALRSRPPCPGSHPTVSITAAIRSISARRATRQQPRRLPPPPRPVRRRLRRHPRRLRLRRLVRPPVPPHMRARRGRRLRPPPPVGRSQRTAGSSSARPHTERRRAMRCSPRPAFRRRARTRSRTHASPPPCLGFTGPSIQRADPCRHCAADITPLWRSQRRPQHRRVRTPGRSAR